jgi:hypothetical protein
LSENQKTLEKAFWNIVDHYELSTAEWAAILAVEDLMELSKYKSERSLPTGEDTCIRVSHLLGIHKNLRILFPENIEVVYKWLKTNRAEFSGRSAMNYILDVAGDPSASLDRLKNVKNMLIKCVNT